LNLSATVKPAPTYQRSCYSRNSNRDAIEFFFWMSGGALYLICLCLFPKQYT
jgi:hypothetical protein